MPYRQRFYACTSADPVIKLFFLGEAIHQGNFILLPQPIHSEAQQHNTFPPCPNCTIRMR